MGRLVAMRQRSAGAGAKRQAWQRSAGAGAKRKHSEMDLTSSFQNAHRQNFVVDSGFAMG
jgi:hypothetical protein